MPRFIDSHSHLHFPAYDEDREAVLARMQEEDVWTLTVGTGIGISKSGIAYAEQTEGVWATVGYHPEHLSSSYQDEAEGDTEPYDITKIRELAQSSKKVVAIGETGLDFYRIDEGRDRNEAIKLQEDAFREHIAIAKELSLPVVIHCREALPRLAEIIQEEHDNGWTVRGVVHCYTGTWAEAQPLLGLGLHLSFTGVITFPPRKTDDPESHVHRVIERIPLDRILIETDAPWLTPVPYRGKRNEPAYVRFVAEQVASLRKTSLDEIATQTTANARALFSI